MHLYNDLEEKALCRYMLSTRVEILLYADDIGSYVFYQKSSNRLRKIIAGACSTVFTVVFSSPLIDGY